MKKATFSNEVYSHLTYELYLGTYDEVSHEFGCDDHIHGICAKKGGTVIGIGLVKTNLEHSTIAHEVVHAINYTLMNINAVPDVENDEHEAYLTGWLTQKIYNKLKALKVRVY